MRIRMKLTRIIVLLVLSSFISSSMMVIPIDASTSNDHIDEPLISRGNTIIIDKGGSGDFTTIQAGIDASNDGDIILINPGIYQENLIIKKNITLNGSNKESTILKGTGIGTGVYVSMKELIIRNMTITNFEFGIDLYNCRNSTLENNIIKINKVGIKTDNTCTKVKIFQCNISEFLDYGLYLRGNNITISNNCFNNSVTSEDYGALRIDGEYFHVLNNKVYYMSLGVGFGINGGANIVENNIIMNCNKGGLGITSENNEVGRSTVQNNTILNCYKGLNGRDGIVFNNNTIKDCIFYGVHAWNIFIANSTIINNKLGLYTYGSTILNNTIIDNSDGIDIDSYNILKNNIIKNNINYGIRTYSLPTTSTIEDNWIENSKYGIELYRTDNFQILKNHIKNNEKGLIARETTGCLITGNEFINNTIQASTDSFDKWYSDYPSGGNYWSDHVTRDVKRGAQQIIDGSDGIDDTPYVINLTTQRDIYPLFRDIVPPVANAGTDIVLDQGDIYLFNSSLSTDDQLVHRVEWEFEYGGEHKVFTDKKMEFKFDMSGTYWVNLTVYDFPGNSDTDDLNITVIDVTDPTPISQGNITIEQGEYALFNASSSWDNSVIMNYTWRFSYGGNYLQIFGMTNNFRFIIPGYYEVTLKVTDTVGRFAETTFKVTVIDTERPIAVAGEDIEANNGDTVYFDASLSTDNGMIQNFTWSFVYENEQKILNGSQVSFFFLKPGRYEVELNVIDMFGNFDNDQLELIVMDTIPPNAVISGSRVQEVGGTIGLDALSSTDNGQIVKYLWKYTDVGSTTVEGPYLNYTFENKGSHKVSLTVYDQWNLSDTLEITIDVIDEQSPIAVAGEDVAIPIGTTHTFDASGSTDDGRIVRYEWSFDYNDTVERLNGKTVEFKFDRAGTYAVVLKVTDQSDNYGVDTVQITVVDTGILKGTVLDKDGAPIQGAKITVKASDGRTYTSTSSENGSFSMEVPMGEATYTISCSGYKSISGSVHIEPMGTTELEPSRTVLEKEKGASIMIFIIIAIIVFIILLVIIGLVFFLIRKGLEQKEEALPEKEPTPEEQLGITVAQPPQETPPPVQENAPISSPQESTSSNLQRPYEGTDDLVSEMMKGLNEEALERSMEKEWTSDTVR